MLKDYYYLTKPGIIRGNLIAAVAGVFLASGRNIDWGLLLTTVLGLGLVIASACVFNNYIDRDIDYKMDRTKDRAMAAGKIPFSYALMYGAALGLAGFFILLAFTHWLAAATAALGFFFYIALYSIFKRRSPLGTAVGSISGATPPVVGYTAVTGSLDKAALLLFLILVFWQMPHFYAIAIYRLKDYKAAGIPVLPAVKGVRATKIQILAYIVAFTLAASLLTAFGYTSLTYLVLALALGMAWFWLGIKGFKAKNDTVWAREMFVFSLIVMLLTCIGISADAVLNSESI